MCYTAAHETNSVVPERRTAKEAAGALGQNRSSCCRNHQAGDRCLPEKGEMNMRRQREQGGGLYKRNGWWVLRYRQTVNEGGQLVTKQKAVQIAAIQEHKTKNLVRQSSA